MFWGYSAKLTPPGRSGKAVYGTFTIVARTESVTFPIERGKTTTVSGKFLTNFISGGLTIDTRWDGEITIDIE